MGTKEGFTLVEILVVIIIIALFLLLLMPQMAEIYLGEQLHQTAVLLHNDLRWAQAKAATEKKNVKVEFQSDSYRVLQLNEEIRTVTIPAQIEIKQAKNIVFASDYAPTGNGKIIISNGRKSYYVYYYQTGRIRISRKANS